MQQSGPRNPEPKLMSHPVSLQSASPGVLVAELRGHEEFINLHTRVHVLPAWRGEGLSACWERPRFFDSGLRTFGFGIQGEAIS